MRFLITAAVVVAFYNLGFILIPFPQVHRCRVHVNSSF